MDTTFTLKDNVFNYRVAGIWVENGYVLLHKQANDSHWALPGGRARMLEDSKSCLVREMKEELDVVIEIERLLWSVENFFSYAGKNFHEIGFYYLIRGVEPPSFYQTAPFFGPEGDRLIYQWVPVPEICNVALYPEFLRKALIELPKETQHLIVSNK
ncbi:ADP-ribose pyrophosphatase YjhB (NUDIX family) [Planomicrobium soli]|uniref:ADP-ribose pyrophosphatase YjhB (NUDIX family) n=1 Tax=Planomicrobium soli TaxID=1176648 RepID=A0A2P8GK99_9BACL|nr:NUDIX hydrolase [Planomicrobium soli]PSL34380.1 ADP-ribose pyrophosphatase YjhB (NUDIX family) [Planomicrobium soli]